jgi:Putative transmembrane protein (PGPGW)
VIDPGPATGEPALIRFYRRLARAYGDVGLGFKIAMVAGFVLLTTAVGIGMVLSIPADHFKKGRPAAPARPRHPLLRWSASLIRNVFGAVLVTLGAIMALPLVPGPGLVFILLGLSVLDFPGKHAMQRRLMRVPGVTRFMNDVRARFGKAPLILDDTD